MLSCAGFHIFIEALDEEELEDEELYEQLVAE
jgi:hypothetical protein